ncbi:MAG TPA: NADPH-dependent FMN reductase [Solirubrobacteraceae bacterium]|nr:NADPH-dependent FMN reductase [Solirubrobacteraceae bacterium]
MRVLGIAGSLRRASHNRQLLRAAADLLPPAVELEVYDGLGDLPPFNEDDEFAPGEAVERWRDAIAGADALLFATPEYNGSIPGALKNAIDWASRPARSTVLRNQPAAVIGASTGMFGAVWAQAELRKVLSTAGARVIDRELPVAAANEAFDAVGQLELEEHGQELASILAELVRAAEERQARVAA